MTRVPAALLAVTAALSAPLIAAPANAATAAPANTVATAAPANTVATAAHAREEAADLALTVAAAPQTAGPGAAVTYTLSLVNNGPSPAQNVTLLVPTPGNTTFTSFAAPPGWSGSAPQQGSTGQVEARLATIPAGGQPSTFTFVVTVEGGDQVEFVTAVGAETPDPNQDNNTAGANTPLRDEADLALTVTHNPAEAPAGGNLTYTLALANAGPAAARDPRLTVAVPPNATFVSFAAPTGWTGSAPQAGGTGTIEATIGRLAPGGRPTTFTLVVTIGAGNAHGSRINLTPAVRSGTPDPNEGNNTKPDAAPVTNVADLSITVDDQPDPVQAQGTITYNLTVTNAGPVAASNAAISADIPSGTTFTSFVAPVGWTSTAPEPGGTGAISATIASMPAGGTATFTLVITATGDAAVSLSASAGTTTNDPAAANNQATAVTTVSAVASSTPEGPPPARRSGLLALSGSSLIRLGGATVALLGLGLLLIALARSRRQRRGW